MIKTRWQKVFRDLWINKTRTILVVLAIAVGVFAFASVFITGDVLVSSMNTQYEAINASTITIYTTTQNNNLARWAIRQPEVIDAQMRAIQSVRLISPQKTYNMDLFVYDDFNNMTVNLITPQQGDWPPGRGEVLLERTVASYLGANIGEELIIELPDGTRHKLVFSGTVHDLNAVPASLFPQLSGYMTLQTLGNIGLPSVYTRLEITALPEYDSRDKLVELGENLQDRLRRTGVQTGNFPNIREPGEHWGRETTQSFTLILSIIGIFSLILSGFLVVNTVSALLIEQRRQIGMMKAIGGTGRQIFGMYLVLVACYGLLALFVAIPIGLGLAYIFTIAVVNFLNLDMVGFHLPLHVLLLEILAALIVPVVAAAIPIRGGLRVSVREALSSYGIHVKENPGWLDQMALKVSRLPRPVLLSLRNTFRRKGRLLLTLSALTMAGTLFIGVVNVRTSLMSELDIVLETLFNYEVQVYFNNTYPVTGLQQRAESLPGVVDTSGQAVIRGQRILPDGDEGDSFTIVGVVPGTDFFQPKIISGRWITDGDRNSMVITSRLAEDMPDVHVGDTIPVKIMGKEYIWTVAGVMKMAFNRNAYATFDYVSSLNGASNQASSLFVRTVQKDAVSQDLVSKELEQKLKDAGVGVSYSMTRETIASTNASQFDFLVSFLLSMAAMSALIGGLGLAGMMGLSVMERTREIGVMRSIGASNSAVGGIVITEAMLIGILSWLLAIPLSIPFSLGFDVLLGEAFLGGPLVFKYSPIGPIVWIIIVIVISVTASILPARRAVRMSIRETLSYE
ncbi:ABC transporter permease [Chloroflexota bacterium]